MTLSKRWFVVVNPTSGNNSAKRKWPEIKTILEAYGFDFDYEFTTYAKHSIKLIHDAVYQGFTNFICVGGDGTIHNVINAVMAQTKLPSSHVKIGVVPIGTGNDWVKTYAIPKDYEKAIQIIKTGNLQQQDVGKLELGESGGSVVYFNNLAGVGFDGLVVSKVGKYKSFGAIAYVLGALMGLFSAKQFKASIRCDSTIYECSALMVLVGICQFSGGGMQLTKNPVSNDGYFDVSITDNFNRMDILKNLPRLFNGKVINSRKIISLKSKVVRIEIKDDYLPFIQADGELIGKGNYSASIIPNAISFFVQ